MRPFETLVESQVCESTGGTVPREHRQALVDLAALIVPKDRIPKYLSSSVGATAEEIADAVSRSVAGRKLSRQKEKEKAVALKAANAERTKHLRKLEDEVKRELVSRGWNLEGTGAGSYYFVRAGNRIRISDHLPAWARSSSDAYLLFSGHGVFMAGGWRHEDMTVQFENASFIADSLEKLISAKKSSVHESVRQQRENDLPAKVGDWIEGGLGAAG